jgi:redox-sensitive bicupin YhaK (pirin superfamily)
MEHGVSEIRLPAGRYRLTSAAVVSEGRRNCVHRSERIKADQSEAAKPRAVRLRTRGKVMGPVVRLVSPGDLGELLKPFVFLDLADIPPRPGNGFGWHPHSGIATLTIIHDGQNEYRETTGTHGGLRPGGIEWMASGRGVWHMARAVGSRNLKGYQVWLLLPPGADLQAPASTYLDADDVPAKDGVRVILGAWEGLDSRIDAPPETTLLDVTLPATRRWTFAPPPGQELGWLAVHSGALRYGDEVADAGDLLIFEDGASPLEFSTTDGAAFIIGSAHRSPYPLHIGNHSVHVNARALAMGEAQIARLHGEYRAKGIF